MALLMNDPGRIRILCVDDHPLFREGIAAVIAREHDMELVGTAATGKEATEQHRAQRPDVTLMDLRLPDMSGIAAITLIRAQCPDARLVVLTNFEGDAEIQRALDAGARGYVLKSSPRDGLVQMIHKVHSGRMHLPSEVAETLAEHRGAERLSLREIEVLKLVAEGNRNRDIAELLAISEDTVKVHIKHIMEKLGARDRTQAVAIAIRRGIFHI
jgi:DNA-binding NarL/FixJ family response regulator